MMAWLVAAATTPVLALASVAADVPARVRDADGPRQPLHAAHRTPDRSSTPTSPGRALFNDPLGTERAQYALVRHVDEKIDGAGPTSVVRLAAYSFAMPSTAQALLRAHRRGAAVKVVVDGHSARWASVRNLRRQLGGNRHRRSFVVVCRHSCRGVAGNQHAKFVTISHARRRDDVVLVGSMNFTAFAASRQFQDLYSVAGNHRLYRQFVRVFKQMTRDRPQQPIHLLRLGDGFGTEVAPVPGRPVVDPVARRLGLVHCRGATGGTGARGRTVLRVSMHAWNGDRGVRLARQVAGLARAGCNVRVLLGVGVGRQVASVLRHAGVSFRRSRGDRPATHQKLMLVSGHFGRARNADYAWTGSHNWTDRSLRNDEVTLRVSGARQVAAYRHSFGRIWRSLSG